MKKTNLKETLKQIVGVLLFGYVCIAEAVSTGCKKLRTLPKKVMALCIAAALVVAMIPAYVFAAGIHTNHCVCGEQESVHSGCKDVEWTAWNGTDAITYDSNNTAYVYLSANAERSSTLEVSNGKTLYLCLNGNTLSPADSFTGRAITVNSGATFVLTDCGGDGSISGFKTSTHVNGTGVYNEGTFTMYAGAISDIISNGHGGGVYNSGTFTMYGGTISNNELTEGTWYGSGAGVYQRKGSFNMYGGTITGNKTVGAGGGVYYSGGTFTMYGGTISDNCADSGGGVYGNYFAMYGGSVINNTATTCGGGIYSYNGTLELSGNITITGNEMNGEQSDIFIGYTVITIKDDFAPTSAIGVTKNEVVGTIVRAADGETLDVEDYKQFFVGEEGMPVYAEDNALELGYTIIEEPDDTNNHTVKTNGDANASYQWAKYGLIAHPVAYESYGPMSLRSVTTMPGMEDAFGIIAARVEACGYLDYNTWDYYANYDAENKHWIASNNVIVDGYERECVYKFDVSYFIILPKKNGTLSVTLIDPLADGQEMVLYIMNGEGKHWLVEEVTPNADGSYSLTAGINYRLLVKDSDDTNNGTYAKGFNDTFPRLTATFTAMGVTELLDGQNGATLDITGLESGAYICKTSWDIYDTPEEPEDDYYRVSAPVTRYDVIFDYGTLGSETKTVMSGETVTPPAPVFAGKVLVGWYTNSSFSTEFNFSNTINANTTIYAKFADYEGDKKTLQDAIDALEADVAELNKLTENGGTVDQINAKISAIESKVLALDELKNKYAEADTALKQELEAADAAINSAIDALTVRVQYLEAGLAAANSKVDTNTSDVTALKSDVAALNTWKAQSQSTIVALQTLTATQSADIARLETAVQDLEAALAAAEARIDDAEDRIAVLEGKVSALETAKQNLDAAVAALNAAINNKADTATLNQKVTDLIAAIAAAEDAAKAYADGKDNALKTELTTAIATAKGEAITAAENLVNTAKAELKTAINNKADISTLNTKVSELNVAIATAEATAKAYTDSAVTTLNVAIITAKDEAVDAAKDLVDAAKAQLQAAIDTKADAATVNAAIANLQNAITTLENAKDNYVSADAALKAELEAAIAKAKQEAIDAAKGHIPYIGTNGNWWIGDTDTGVDANGIKGDKGADGVGIAKIEKTATNGNVDTYTVTLTNGKTYTFTVTNGKDGADGKDGTDGKDGENGKDGLTPFIGENGNWWIGDTDTGVKAVADDSVPVGSGNVTEAEGVNTVTVVAIVIAGVALLGNVLLAVLVLKKKKSLV